MKDITKYCFRGSPTLEAFFEDRGYEVGDYSCACCDLFYFLRGGEVRCSRDAPIEFTLAEESDFPPREYPKVMLVSMDNIDFCKRVVFTEKNSKYLCWNGATTLKEAEEVTRCAPWNYAKDLPKEEKVELTDDYTATKKENFWEVGCQKIPFEKVEELYKLQTK